MDKKNLNELKMILAKHTDNLQKYGSWVGEHAAEEFEKDSENLENLIERIYKNFGSYGFDKDTQDKLTESKTLIAELRETAYDDEIDFITQQQESLVKNENKWNYLWLLALLGNEYDQLNKKDSNIIINYGNYNKKELKKIFYELTQKDIDRIFQSVKNGLKNGDTLEEVKQNVKNESEKTDRFIKSNTISVMNGISNDVSLMYAEKYKLKVAWVALMENTCHICEDLNGTVYNTDDDIPFIPQHINCHCRLVTIDNETSDKIDTVNDIFNTSFEEYIMSLTMDEGEKRLGKLLYSIFNSNNKENINMNKYIYPDSGNVYAINNLSEDDIKSFS